MFKFWFGYNLPAPYKKLDSESKSLFNKFWEILLKLVIHPIKRRIAKYYVFILQKIFGLKVIGITGSSGKTTTKDMLFSILDRKAFSVCSTKNIDPVYNIPTTILKTPPWARFLILEMGIEYPGEMDYYLWLVRPDMAIITNIAQTHTSYLNDLNGVLEEKFKLALNISSQGKVILNGKDSKLKQAGEKISKKVIYFGLGTKYEPIDISYNLPSGTEFKVKISKESVKLSIPLLGEPFVENAMAALACADTLGVDTETISQGLKSFSGAEHRMRVYKGKNEAVILDDSYNNNPNAAKRAVDVLVEVAKDKKKILIFGDMLELGKDEKFQHRKIGEYVSSKIDFLVGYGPLAKITVDSAADRMGYRNAIWVKDKSEIAQVLKGYLSSNVVVLIKGSRKIGLDSVVSELL